MKVSVIIPCKSRLSHLKQCLPTVLAQTYKDIEIICVDYNCPEETFDYVRRNFKDSRIVNVRCNVKPNEWSLSAARNQGFLASIGEIVLFIDADAILEPGFIEAHVNALVPGSFFCGWGYKSATGCCMVYARDFKAINGYNEALQGYGFEDIDLYTRLEKTFHMHRKPFISGIETLPHDDSIRNQYHDNRDIWETDRINKEIAQKQFKGLYNDVARNN